MSLLAGSPAQAADPVATATLAQEQLPALASRQAAAEARQAAARRYYAGQGEWPEAFVSLAGMSLAEPSVVRARSWTLRDGLGTCAAERASAATADGLSARDVERLVQATDAACEAEDRATQLELRFLAAIGDALQRAPGLQEEAVREQIETWRPDVPAGEEPSPAWSRAMQLERGLRALQAAALRSAAVPGDPALSLAVAERVAVEVPSPWPTGDDAAAIDAVVDGLGRVVPLLSGDAVAEVEGWLAAASQAKLSARAEELKGLLEAPPPVKEPRAIEVIESELEARRAASVALEQAEPPDAAQVLAVEVAELEVRWARVQRDRLEEELQRAKRLQAVGVGPADDPIDAEEARRVAEQAQARAHEEAANQAELQVREETAALRAEIADRLEREEARRVEAVGLLEEASDRLEQLTTELSAAMALPPLDNRRAERIDQTYGGLRELTTSLRVDNVEREHVRHELTAKTNERIHELSAAPVPAGDGVSALAAEWDQARTDLITALRGVGRHGVDELDAGVRLLRAAKDQRRIARDEASAVARRDARRGYLPELAAEFREVPSTVEAGFRRGVAIAKAVPSYLTDLTAIFAFLTGSLELVALLLAWLWARRGAPRWVKDGLASVWLADNDPDVAGTPLAVAQWMHRWLEPGDPRRMAEPVGRFCRGLADVMAAQVLIWLVGDRMPLLGFLAWVWFARVAWRTWPLLVDVVFALDGERRPAVRVVTEATRHRAMRTVQWLLGWQLIVRLVDYALVQVLAADRWADLAWVLSTAAIVVIGWVLLYGWHPSVKKALASDTSNVVARWACAVSSPLLSAPAAAVGAVLLLVRWGSHVGARLAASRAGLSWLGALVARRQLKDAGVAERSMLPHSVRGNLVASGAPLPRDEVRGRMAEVYDAWKEQHAGGIVMLVGDRGSGKSGLASELLEASDPEVGSIEIRVPGRLSGTAAAMTWLADALGVEPDEPNSASVAAAVNELPRAWIAVRDLHLVFLRVVGGFSAMRALLDVMQRTAGTHFWVCTMHEHTWHTLRGTPAAVSLAMVREAVTLEPLSANELSTWIVDVAQHAGYDITFEGLRAAGRGEDDPRAAGKERSAYWRLLAEASQGNPGVAKHFWITSLAPVSSGSLDVALFAAPTVTDLGGLSDDALFVLAALVVHDGLDIDQLATVLNAPRGRVRATCRRLRSSGVLTGNAEATAFRVSMSWLPAVERLLRQKSFLYA